MKTNIFKNKKPYFVWLGIKILIIAALLTMDLLTKTYFANHYANGQGNINVINGLLSFTYAENTGAAFSIFSNSLAILAILSCIFIICFFVYDFFSHQKNFWYVFSFVLIVSGAVGNFVDRVLLGYVRDFIRFDFISFPIFNLADTFLTIGLISYAIYIFFFYDKTEKQVTKQK